LQENKQSQPAYVKNRFVFRGKKKKNANKTIDFTGVSNWLRGLDLNQRPSGYETERISNICYIIDVFIILLLLCGMMCGILRA
jgi:hypothetical protein